MAGGTPIALQHIATPLRVLPSKKKSTPSNNKIHQRWGEKEARRQQNVQRGVSCLLECTCKRCVLPLAYTPKRCVLPAGPFMEWLLCVASLYCHVSFAKGMTVCCSVLQRVAACYSVLQCVAVCCNVLQCVAVCCIVLQCVAVRCSVLQCVCGNGLDHFAK